MKSEEDHTIHDLKNFQPKPIESDDNMEFESEQSESQYN